MLAIFKLVMLIIKKGLSSLIENIGQFSPQCSLIHSA